VRGKGDLITSAAILAAFASAMVRPPDGLDLPGWFLQSRRSTLLIAVHYGRTPREVL